MSDTVDDTKSVPVQFLATSLSSGREVWVGYNTEDPNDHSYFFKFFKDGVETKLRLSEEACSAIILLKPKIDLHRDTGSALHWEYKAVAAIHTSEPDAS